MAAQALNVIGVAIEDLQKRQGLMGCGKLARHLEGRDERHDRVVALVVLAAEGAGVGQRRGRDQTVEWLAAMDPLDHGGKQAVDRGVLHEGDKRLERPEGQAPR